MVCVVLAVLAVTLASWSASTSKGAAAAHEPLALDSAGICRGQFVSDPATWNTTQLEELHKQLAIVDDIARLPATNTIWYAPARHIIRNHTNPEALGGGGGSQGGGHAVRHVRPPLLYCWIPKNACSMFKLLFLRLILTRGEWRHWQARHRRDGGKKAAHIVDPLYRQQWQAANETLTQLLAMATRDRSTSAAPSSAPAAAESGDGGNVLPGLVVTRNPYVRLLSGYLHTVTNASKDGLMSHKWQTGLLKGHGFEAPPTFREWVLRLHMIGATHINRHFKPQTSFCGMASGTRFAYQVKLETLQATYPCLVQQLGLGPWVDTKWRDFYSGRDCFYKPDKDLTCEWWRDALNATASGTVPRAGRTQGTVRARRQLATGASLPCAATPGGTALLREVEATQGERLEGQRVVHHAAAAARGSSAPHKTDAAAMLQHYYDPEITKSATELYARDFELLGYQTWLGPPHPIILD